MVLRQVLAGYYLYDFSLYIFSTLFNTFLHIINASHLILSRTGGGDGSRGGSTHERIAWEITGDIRDFCTVNRTHDPGIS